jgi:hypothetical protein
MPSELTPDDGELTPGGNRRFVLRVWDFHFDWQIRQPTVDFAGIGLSTKMVRNRLSDFIF